MRRVTSPWLWLTVFAFLVVAIVSVNAASDGGQAGIDPAATAAEAYRAKLLQERQQHLEAIRNASGVNSEEWSFLWYDELKDLLTGSVPGFSATLGQSLVLTWVKEKRAYLKPGDFMPLFMLKRDGSEARVALYRPNGTITILRMTPLPYAADVKEFTDIKWQVEAYEVR